METKPTSEEYESACAVVKRMQEFVRDKFCSSTESWNKELMVVVGMPTIGHDVVKFQYLRPDSWGGRSVPQEFLFPYEMSFPSAWLDMSDDDIKKSIQEKERIQKERDLRLNEERLAMVLEIGMKVETEGRWTGHKAIVYGGCYTEADRLYLYSEYDFNKEMELMKLHVKKAEEETAKELAQISELKKKYPNA